MSFTPEPALKDIINRPFSHFETVVLNDATVLEDTLQENDSEDDEDTEIKNSGTRGGGEGYLSGRSYDRRTFGGNCNRRAVN